VKISLPISIFIVVLLVSTGALRRTGNWDRSLCGFGEWATFQTVCPESLMMGGPKLGRVTGEVSGQQSVPDQKLKDDWAQALAANYLKVSAELKQQIAGMPLYDSMMRTAWPQLSGEVKAKYRALWAEQLKSLLPAPPQAPAAANRAAVGKKSVAELMAPRAKPSPPGLHEQEQCDDEYAHDQLQRPGELGWEPLPILVTLPCEKGTS
jgi:hypothetical protein